MTKSELRKIYLEKRQQTSNDVLQQLASTIYEQVYDLDLSQVKTAHIFLTLKKFKEIDTLPIIHYLREKNIKVVVSKSDFTTNSLQHYYLEKQTKTELSRYGIPEPLNAKKAKETDLDLVFVPLLISDKHNFRVGYGKGFYDRFLAKCRKNVATVGLNLFKPIDEIKDINEFDVPLDKVIYPNG